MTHALPSGSRWFVVRRNPNFGDRIDGMDDVAATDQASAEAKARRLAENNPGATYSIFEGTEVTRFRAELTTVVKVEEV